MKYWILMDIPYKKTHKNNENHNCSASNPSISKGLPAGRRQFGGSCVRRCWSKRGKWKMNRFPMVSTARVGLLIICIIWFNAKHILKSSYMNGCIHTLCIYTWDMFHVEEENNLSLAMSSTLFLDQLGSHNQRDHHRVQNLRRYPAV